MPPLLNYKKFYGILRHEHAHVHELHATQAHLAITTALSQIAPNIFAYSTLFALIFTSPPNLHLQ